MPAENYGVMGNGVMRLLSAQEMVQAELDAVERGNALRAAEEAVFTQSLYRDAVVRGSTRGQDYSPRVESVAPAFQPRPLIAHEPII